MIKNSLWAEITICGFVYFLSILFIIFNIIGVYDFKFLLDVKDYLLYLSIASVAFSYILGILAHRILMIIYDCLNFIIGKIFQNNKLIDKWTKSFQYKPEQIKVYQLGNERLNRELDFQFSLLAMSKSLCVGFTLLSISLSLWMINSKYKTYTLEFLLIFLTLGLLFLIVYFRQRKLFNSLRNHSFQQFSD